MDARAVYACPRCSALTPALITGLPEPRSLVSDRSAEALEAAATARAKLGDPPASDLPDVLATIADASIEAALRYATCPRCGERNPAGVQATHREARMTRLVGAPIALGFAVGCWLFPWFSWFTLAVLGLVAVTVLVVGWRSRALTPRAAAQQLGGFAALCLITTYLPRAALLVPLALAIGFARTSPSESPWERARATLRFEGPYR